MDLEGHCRQGSNQNVCTQSTTESSVGQSTPIPLPDWTIGSKTGDHLWRVTNNSGAVCHVRDTECYRSGPKKKCSVCRIACHDKCMEQLQFPCRRTYTESDVRLTGGGEPRKATLHHWVARRRSQHDNRCNRCNKAIGSNYPFASKDFVAVQCTWCKVFYHNKSSCFISALATEPCTLGPFCCLIVPPDWIIKLSNKSTLAPSVRRTNSLVCTPSDVTGVSVSDPVPRSREHTSMDGAMIAPSHQSAKNSSSSLSLLPVSLTLSLPFIVKPNPIELVRRRPVLVFVNPKSGGNQGFRMIRRFQWILNPRQVFDLSVCGPRLGLELFGHIPNLRVLACGGDGTVGWIFATIDALKLNPAPPVAVLPLGTGNDLARSLNWGPGYTDEPITRILRAVENGETVSLDRWKVECDPLPSADTSLDPDEDEASRSHPASARLPLQIFNNYFSLGADAAAALGFHESREANPEKFNSRLKNKIVYAGKGGKELLFRSWRDLSMHITLKCDDKDMTPLVRSLKPHCLLFLNIPRYGSGTSPWGTPPSGETGFEPAKFDDGLLEVIALSSRSLALLHVGGHGQRVCQCHTVSLTTTKVLPMQIDGEPCRLVPSTVHIRLSHQALVIQRPMRANSWIWRTGSLELDEPRCGTVDLRILAISLADYEMLTQDALALRQSALDVGSITLQFTADLTTVRQQIEQHCCCCCLTTSSTVSPEPNSETSLCLSKSFVFLDSITAACRFFRIEQSRESMIYLTDMCNMEEVFVIDPCMASQLENHVNKTEGK